MVMTVQVRDEYLAMEKPNHPNVKKGECGKELKNDTVILKGV